MSSDEDELMEIFRGGDDGDGVFSNVSHHRTATELRTQKRTFEQVMSLIIAQLLS